MEYVILCTLDSAITISMLYSSNYNVKALQSNNFYMVPINKDDRIIRLRPLPLIRAFPHICVCFCGSSCSRGKSIDFTIQYSKRILLIIKEQLSITVRINVLDLRLSW